MHRKGIFFIIILALLLYFRTSLFVVDVTEYAIKLTLGKPVAVYTEPGLKVKWPFLIGDVVRYDNRIQVTDLEDTEFLTSDKKNIIVKAFVVWEVKEPLKFLKSVYSFTAAEAHLSSIITSEIGAALGNAKFANLVTSKEDEMKLEEVVNHLSANCKTIAEKDYGIKIIDVRLKRLNFPDQNKASVFERMRTERQRIAKKFRSEGEEQAAKIRAQADKEKNAILAEARMKAEQIKGEAEAEAARIYAEAINQDPEFYQFLRTLEAYRKILNERTTLILPEDSDLMKLLLEGTREK